MGGLLQAQQFTVGRLTSTLTARKHQHYFLFKSMEDILLWGKSKFNAEAGPRLDILENVARGIILVEC